MKWIEQVEKVYEIMEEHYEPIDNLDFQSFEMLLGIMIDQYEADHNLNVRTTNQMLQRLIESRVFVHTVCGTTDRREGNA